ncbi:hypothetical protein Agub_g11409 [Astrephomene gubernaculifera]|uniref:Branched-chain-amino-acid aminotransferase n=1 Tax=Astrephomene gubernaculifera TaxID=47775 RepID=A0AAD3HR16_9CHLO|nr:hypothetical protein Agub_g11409 [Astrephomene gubernaculifera]
MSPLSPTPDTTTAPPPPPPPLSSSTSTSTNVNVSVNVSTNDSIDWSRIRLGVDAAPTMFLAHWSADTHRWDGGALLPYGPLSLLPAAQVLNYGQSVFEGLKAYRCTASASASASDADAAGNNNINNSSGCCGPTAGATGGRILLFRPGCNAARFSAGAVRMCMPPVPRRMFLAALHAVVRANAAWVPPPGRGSLYLRPLLLGTGPLLGLCPAPSYTFVVYAVPVGGRAKEGRLCSLDYLIHDSLHRAAPRGVGSTKAAGNYSPCLAAQAQARQRGCADCIFLDARSDTYLEEGSGCNIFVTHGSVVTTPPAAGSILPGITRASLLQLAAALGYRCREAPITVEEAMQAEEMFASGTAVVVQPIGSVTYKDKRVTFPRDDSYSSSSYNGNGHCNGNTNGTDRSEANGRDSSTGQQDGLASSSAATVSAIDGTTTSENGRNGCSNGRHPSACNGQDNGNDNGHAKSVNGHDDSAVNGTAVLPKRAAEDEERDGGSRQQQQPPQQSPLSGHCTTKEETAVAEEEVAALLLQAAAPVPSRESLSAGVGPVAQRLYSLLTGIQYGRVADPFGWMVEVEMEGPTEGPLHLERLLGEESEEEAEAEAQQGVAGAAGASLTAAGGKGAVVAAGRSVFADPNLE